MSKICGLWHFAFRPVSQEDAARFRAALAAPGYTPESEHVEPGLMLAWAAGSEPARGSGLFTAEDRSVALWDGRIDNRDELLRGMSLSQDCADSAIVLNRYREKGIDGLHDVIGDWSVCIWDARRREVVLASDYAGIRPLYYHRGARTLFWSSSLADLVNWTGIADLEEAYVGSFLFTGNASTVTPYHGIFEVPSGHAVRITAESISQRAFWTLPIDREIRYRDERQYEEQLLALFRESIQSRISGATACAELSGGLDSSSVVCMADRLRNESNRQAPRLATFSYTHEDSLDEKFFREVERVCDVSPHHLDLRECPAAAPDAAGARPGWWEPRFRVLSQRMAAIGSGVLMTGQLGDLITGNIDTDSGQVTDWLSKGRLWKASLEAYAWGKSMQVPVYPILWRSLREACFGWMPPLSPFASVGAMRVNTEDSLEERFRTRLGQQDRIAEEPWRHAPAGKRLRFRALSETLRASWLQTPEALQHLSYTHPFVHRPLVEFLLAIPLHVLFGPGQPRRLMRRAFAGLLPPMVRGRKSKGLYGATFRSAVLPMAATLLTSGCSIQLVERGYVQRGSLIGRLEKFTQGLDCNESQLQLLILLEFWLRNRMPAQSSGTAPVTRLQAALS